MNKTFLKDRDNVSRYIKTPTQDREEDGKGRKMLFSSYLRGVT